MQQPRYEYADLLSLGAAIFEWAGLPSDKAAITARCLLAADLMGHTTHGLQLCRAYIKQFESGDWRTDGEIEVVSDNGGNIVWNANYLPGPWVTDRAVHTLIERVDEVGVATLAIRECSHIGCLQAYLTAATDHGCMMILMCSDPFTRSVAPFGGIDPLFTPNPIAVGIPTEKDPILVDVSCSITTNGSVMRTHDAGERLPGKWLLTADGELTDDPGAAVTDPPATVLPIGGMDYGHKGYALALMVEALTQGLSGYGRSDAPDRWGASMFIQLLGPQAFAGSAAFTEQTEWLREACCDSRPRPDCEAVRVPGQRAQELQREMLANGVVLAPPVEESLRRCCDDADLIFPEARG
ncbi:MAG: Ldh family oxidoreductase [Lentisphaeria bacterium]